MIINNGYIKVNHIYNVLKDGTERNRTVYIYGRIGSGKSSAVEYYFRKIRTVVLSGLNGKLDAMPDLEKMRRNVIIIKDVSWIEDEQSRQYILHAIKSGTKQLVFLSTAALPTWLSQYAVRMHWIIGDEKSLALTNEQAAVFFEEKGIPITHRDMIRIMEDTEGNPLAMGFTAACMKNTGRYDEDVRRKALLSLYHYLDAVFFDHLDSRLQNLLISTCAYKKLDYEMVSILSGYQDVPALLERLSSLDSFLFDYGDKYFSYRRGFQEYLKWKRSIIWNEQKSWENYHKAAEYYHKKGDLYHCLDYLKRSGDQAGLIDILKKETDQDICMQNGIETAPFYKELSEGEIMSSPALIQSEAMLDSLAFQPGGSEGWRHCLDEDEKRSLALSILLPHLGTNNLEKRFHDAVDGMKSGLLEKKDFLNDNASPSVLHGKYDLTSYAIDDETLTALIKAPLETVYGKLTQSVLDLYKAEAGYEHQRVKVLDMTSVLSKASDVFIGHHNNDGLFSVYALGIRMHMSRGEVQRADELLRMMRQSLLSSRESSTLLKNNVMAFSCWMDILRDRTDQVSQWAEGIDENENLYVSNISIYLNQIRCLILKGKNYSALTLIERLLEPLKKYDMQYAWIKLLLYKAVIFYRMKDERWQEYLETALKEGEKLHLYRCMADEGAALRPLLEEFGRDSVSKEYLAELQKETRQMNIYYPNYLQVMPVLKEPLTDTEETILHLLCEELNSEEICSLMNITYSGLRFHNKNIYRKLGAANRQEAIRTAFRLGLYY